VKILRPYQQKSLEILSQNASGLDASEMGAGKTLVGVERARHLDRRLVVCPLNTQQQWFSTFAEQFPALTQRDMLHIVGTPLSDPDSWKRLLAKEEGTFIIGWEALRGRVPQETRRANTKKRTKNPGLTLAAIKQAMKDGHVPPWDKTGVWDLVIADEVHRICSRTAAQTKILGLIGKNARHKLALSGTPGGSEPAGLWSVLNWLWPDKYTSYWDWVKMWLHVEEEPIGGGRTTPVIGGEKFPGLLWKTIPCVVRHRTKDILPDLPGVIERTVQVPMAPRQEEIYREFEEQSLAWLNDQPVATPLTVVQRIRLRQAALGMLTSHEKTVRRFHYTVGDEVTVFVSSTSGVVEKPGRITSIGRLYVTVTMDDTGRKTQFHVENQTWVRNPEKRWFRTALQESGADLGTYEEETSELDIPFDPEGPQPKIDAIREIISDLPRGEPVLIFTHSAKWARLAAEKLSKDFPTRAWTGGLTQKKKDELRSSFGKSVQVIIAQLKTISEGTDGFQHVCRCEIWASVADGDVVLNPQAERRLHRPGQTSPVQRWRLITPESIDDEVYMRLLLKQHRMQQVYRDKETT